MVRRFRTTAVMIFIVIFQLIFTLQASGQGEQGATPQITPEQWKAIQSELGKSGGQLTPEAIEALKSRPEFKGLSPEEVAKGKQFLQQKEKGAAEEGEKPVETETAVGIKKTVIGEEPAEKSLFERARLIGKYQDISLHLLPFGYEFFSKAAVSVITERKDVPVPLKYVVGPGDEVKLLLWGRVNAQYNLTVDRDGKITIPQIGPLFVAGMTFEEMSKQVIKQTEQIVGASVDISMGSLKTIPIFVLGDVQKPGSYTVGSFATITDALLLAGGPTGIGSMRNIQVKRKGKVITIFDLYDLFLKGDKSKDITLMAGDVVFVPVVGPLVGIAGNVKRPAIYELCGRYDMESLIDLAGGIIPTAYTQQIQVERIVRNERQVLLDINDKDLRKAASITLQDADLVKIFNIVEKDVNAVYLQGNAKRPGKYEFKAGMGVGDLLRGPDDLLPETCFDYALIKRLKPPGLEVTLVPFNLGHLILKKGGVRDIALEPRDNIYIFSKWFFEEKPTVFIEGEIRGECSAGQESPEALIGGGLGRPKQEAPSYYHKKQGRLEYKDIDAIGKELNLMESDLKKDNLFDLAELVSIMEDTIRSQGRIPDDSVRILQGELIKVEKKEMAARLKEIEKKAKVSCELPLDDGMRVKDLILNSGGLTDKSYLEKGEIIRKGEGGTYQTLYFNVAKAMENEPEHNIALQDKDRIIIHSIWEQVYKKSVTIEGDVAKPDSYQYTEGMTVRDLVFKGGNILESAYLDEAEISSLVIEEGRKTSKTQHRTINLKRALEGDPNNNLPLRPYDRLFVKRIPDWGAMKFVTVTGEVKFPGRYVFRKGEKLSSLLERAGGYTPRTYLKGATFTRESARRVQEDRFKQLADELEEDILKTLIRSVEGALTEKDAKSMEQSLVAKRELLKKLKTARATGRVVIRLSALKDFKKSCYDLELEEGDTLNIPSMPSIVNVMGNVYNQTSIVYIPDRTVDFYLSKVGGPTADAEEDNIYLVKADGTVISRTQKGTYGPSWDSEGRRWISGGFMSARVDPGDTILVPSKVAVFFWKKELMDWTTIIFQTAVAAGVAISAF